MNSSSCTINEHICSYFLICNYRQWAVSSVPWYEAAPAPARRPPAARDPPLPLHMSPLHSRSAATALTRWHIHIATASRYPLSPACTRDQLVRVPSRYSIWWRRMCRRSAALQRASFERLSATFRGNVRAPSLRSALPSAAPRRRPARETHCASWPDYKYLTIASFWLKNTFEINISSKEC